MTTTVATVMSELINVRAQIRCNSSDSESDFSFQSIFIPGNEKSTEKTFTPQE